MPDAPAATPVLSTTSTSSPSAARCQAVDSPCTPAPTTSVRTEPGSGLGKLLLQLCCPYGNNHCLIGRRSLPRTALELKPGRLTAETAGERCAGVAQHGQQFLSPRCREATHRSLHTEDRRERPRAVEHRNGHRHEIGVAFSHGLRETLCAHARQLALELREARERLVGERGERSHSAAGVRAGENDLAGGGGVPHAPRADAADADAAE